MSAPTLPFRRRVENSFADGVRDQLTAQGITSTTLPVYAGGGTNTDSAFFLVVACMESEELHPGMHYADIRLSLCCATSSQTTAEHDALVSAVQLALGTMATEAMGDEVKFRGWKIMDERSDTEEDTHGTVVFIRAGVLDLTALE